MALRQYVMLLANYNAWMNRKLYAAAGRSIELAVHPSVVVRQQHDVLAQSHDSDSSRGSCR